MTKELTNVSKNCKGYWSLLRCILNNKKIPLIPPLFHENKFATGFKEKADPCNSHFTTQCSLISNSTKLPSHIRYLTDNLLSCVSFFQDKIAKETQNLDSKNTHGQDISIRMPKVCGPSIYKPLEIIFNQCLETGVFPSEWKKGNIVPIHKKEGKQTLKNYRPTSSRLMFNELLELFIENKLISSCQSGFEPGDFCINQLLSITLRYIVLLMKTLKLEVSSSISQRHSIGCGMMVSFLN